MTGFETSHHKYMAPSRKVSKQTLKETRVLFVLGSGVGVLFLGLVGAAIYNGLWDDNGKWRNRQYGLPEKLHILAVSIVVFALVGAVFLLLAAYFAIYRIYRNK